MSSFTISGWGDNGVQDTSTEKLQEAVVTIVQNSNCIERMNQTEDMDEDLIVCAGGAEMGPCKVLISNQNIVDFNARPNPG